MLAPTFPNPTKNMFFFGCFNHPTMRIPVWKFGKCKTLGTLGCHGFHPSKLCEAQNSSSSSLQLSIAGDWMILDGRVTRRFSHGFYLLTCWLTPLNWWHYLFFLGGVGDSQKHLLYKHAVYNYTLPETNIAQVITFFWWAGFSGWIMD